MDEQIRSLLGVATPPEKERAAGSDQSHALHMLQLLRDLEQSRGAQSLMATEHGRGLAP